MNKVHAAELYTTAVQTRARARAHACGLHVCYFCHLVTSMDPMYKYQYQHCEGRGAPLMLTAEWETFKGTLETGGNAHSADTQQPTTHHRCLAPILPQITSH